MGKAPSRQPPRTNQHTPTIRALITAAKAKKHQVDDGYYLGDSLLNGPVFVLTGVDFVKAWYNENGRPQFQKIDPHMAVYLKGA